jgi:hypothetical protein
MRRSYLLSIGMLLAASIALAQQSPMAGDPGKLPADLLVLPALLVSAPQPPAHPSLVKTQSGSMAPSNLPEKIVQASAASKTSQPPTPSNTSALKPGEDIIFFADPDDAPPGLSARMEYLRWWVRSHLSK